MPEPKISEELKQQAQAFREGKTKGDVQTGKLSDLVREKPSEDKRS